MRYDWHAAFRIGGEADADALTRRKDAFSEVQDPYAQLRLLSQVQALDSLAGFQWVKERSHYRAIVHRVRGKAPYTADLIVPQQQRLERLGLLWPRLYCGVLQMLLQGSFSLQFRFTLEEPVVSKDDAPFYPHENPLRKEWVFKVPMIAGSGWKGSLRSAMHWLNDGQENDDLRLLFGPPRPEGTVPDGYFRAGRLLFYPTYFDALELEMLNPHNRESGGGRDPFNLECVPAGGHGVFSLLYVPFDCAGLSWDEYRAEVGRHLVQVARSLQAMFRSLGFSAKRTSGFGLAAEAVEAVEGQGKGTLTIHAQVFRDKQPGVSTAPPVWAGPPPRPDGIEEFMENGEFPSLGKGELRDRSWASKRVSRYKKVRDAYLQWQAALQASEQQAKGSGPEKPTEPQATSLRPLTFASFTELVLVADGAARLLEAAHE